MSEPSAANFRAARRPGLIAAVAVAVAVVAIGAVVAVIIVLAGRRNHSRPDPTAAAYLDAWSRQDWPAMLRLTDRPPPDFTAIHQRVVKDLQLASTRYQAGPRRVRVHGAAADVAYTGHLAVAGIGPWDLPGILHLQRHNNRWLVEWSAATLHPAMPPGGHFALDRTWPARADILGAGGTSLTGQTGMVSIGVQGSAIKDLTQMTDALVKAGADPAKVSTALVQAKAHPDQFVAVVDVTEDRYQQLRPEIFPIPGTRFVRHTVTGAVTADLSVHVVGSIGPVTAEQLKTLGSPYRAGDLVGQGGIELGYERQMAGSPGASARIVDAKGTTVTTAMSWPAHRGAPVQTTLELHTQQAAEKALNGVSQPAALVAVRASTGEVLAVVSRPIATAFDRALDGRYPPGSTFKVVTSAALLSGGLTLNSPASCPPTISVGGRTFHNFEGETLAALPLHRAFAISCNTAFIGLSARLSAQALVASAGQFGFGNDPKMGLAAFGGRIPAPADDVAKAATAIGQAQVEASPLTMAVVAAAVDAGADHPARLVAGAADDSAPTRPLDPTVVAGLRTMMAEVVASGTGTPAAVQGGQPVFGKTGTAEFGNANPPTTHAWFIGYRGDVAFAVLVEGGGVGGQVAAPLAAKFLSGL
jgi:cell division protein FtsI/penicillin-binding protein 2